nr:chymotrypsin-1-like isoform X1 [Onthophagus taurus]
MLIRVLTLFSFWLYLIGCNDVDRNVTKRIVAGYTAFKGQYPYQVAILHAADGLICGGSIITQKWVLSAAHCFDRYNNNEMGFTILAGDMSKPSGQEMKVTKVVLHECYSLATYCNDIALVALENPLKFSRKVHSIPLTMNYISKTSCSILSWNPCLEKDQKPYSYLSKVCMKTISEKKCVNHFARLPNATAYLNHNKTCAIITSKRKNATGLCSIDSGSPLVHKNEQIGILSNPNTEFSSNSPSIFTRISSYINWISTNMHLHGEKCSFENVLKLTNEKCCFSTTPITTTSTTTNPTTTRSTMLNNQTLNNAAINNSVLHITQLRNTTTSSTIASKNTYLPSCPIIKPI